MLVSGAVGRHYDRGKGNTGSGNKSTTDWTQGSIFDLIYYNLPMRLTFIPGQIYLQACHVSFQFIFRKCRLRGLFSFTWALHSTYLLSGFHHLQRCEINWKHGLIVTKYSGAGLEINPFFFISLMPYFAECKGTLATRCMMGTSICSHSRGLVSLNASMVVFIENLPPFWMMKPQLLLCVAQCVLRLRGEGVGLISECFYGRVSNSFPSNLYIPTTLSSTHI